MGANKKEDSTDRLLLAEAVMKARSYRLLRCKTPHGGEANLSSILAVLSPLDSIPVTNELAGERGWAVEVVLPVNQLDRLMIELHKIGAREITVMAIDRYVP